MKIEQTMYSHTNRWIVALVMVLVTMVGQAQTLDQKIERLLEAQKAVEAFQDLAANLVVEQKEQYDDINPAFWDSLLSEIATDGDDQLMARMVPIYRDRYTVEEIDYLLDFYTSDIGLSIQKKSTPIKQMMTDTGVKWGEEIAARILAKAQEVDAQLFAKELTGCEDLQVGEFLQVYADGTEILLNRTVGRQQEQYQGNTFHFSIEWLSSCRYRLVEVDAEGQAVNNAQVLTYTIYETYEGGHKVIANVPGTDLYDKSDLYTVVKN